MGEPNDYIGALVAEEGDVEQSGVKGMRWGIRRDRSALKAAAAKRTTEAPKSTDAHKTTGNIQDHVESSSARYARLATQAKAGKGSDLTEQDLKFFNARTDAIAKVNKMNEVKPGWLAETTKNVVQKSAQRQMQMLSDTLADKYIGNPLGAALKTKPVKPEDNKSDN